MKSNFTILNEEEIQKIFGGGYGCTDNSTPEPEPDNSETLDRLKQIEESSGSAGVIWGLVGMGLGGC